MSSFSCKKEKDVERFLKKHAVNNEIISKSRTFLLFDRDVFVAEKRFVLVAYFTIALKSLELQDGLTQDELISLDGKFAEFHGEPIKTLPCYLIGQIGRNDIIKREELCGAEILEEAFRIIQNARNSAGGRMALVECSENEKLITFYQNNGFEYFQTDSTGKHPMIQMIFRFHKSE